jgi:hypothetical protein
MGSQLRALRKRLRANPPPAKPVGKLHASDIDWRPCVSATAGARGAIDHHQQAALRGLDSWRA